MHVFVVNYGKFLLPTKSYFLVLQVPNNYETDLIRPIIEKVSELAKLSYSEADEKTKLNYKVLPLISDTVFCC